MDIEVKISKIGLIETVSDKLQKRLLICDTFGTYSKKICFTLTNQFCSLVDKFKVGDVVQIDFSPESREHQDKWYNTLKAYKINALGVPIVDSAPIEKKEFEESKSDDPPF